MTSWHGPRTYLLKAVSEEGSDRSNSLGLETLERTVEVIVGQIEYITPVTVAAAEISVFVLPPRGMRSCTPAIANSNSESRFPIRNRPSRMHGYIGRESGQYGFHISEVLDAIIIAVFYEMSV